ncbi:MAG: SHOCT domain-containing protein [Actinobacteria bacterium]|nr:SHOCT domain-containing protein [Actinomycetota bacterium]
MTFGWIFMSIFWILAIAGIVYVVKLITCKRHWTEESAMDILKKRYAKGEINKEEFEKMKNDITKE